MKRILAVLMLTATPALATGDLSCAAPDGSASIHMGIGHVPVLAILSARIEAAGQVWSTAAGGNGETAIVVGQGIRTGEFMAVDFTDPNIEGAIARLRTWSVHESGDWVEAGWLAIPGHGAWPMVCTAG